MFLTYRNKLKDILYRPYECPEFLNVKHIPSLDGWRAVAILMVILGHLMLTLQKGTLFHSILRITVFGSLGVKIFFVLSGFLITTLLIKEKIKFGEINIKNFFIRRFLRIVPVLYLYITVLYLLNSVITLNLSTLNFLGPILYINNFNFLPGKWLTGHTWSLAVEEQFYLIWPFLFKSLKNSLLLCVGIILIIPLVRIIQYISPQTENYILAPFFIPASSIFMGAFISLICFNPQISTKITANIKNYKLVWFATAILVIYSIYCISNKGRFGYFTLPFGNILTDFSIAYLLLFSIIRKDHLIFQALNSKAFVQIGIISYSLYIWQQMFIIPIGYYPALEPYLFFPVNLVLVFIFGFASYYFYEKPFLKLKLFFSIH
ncbi:acyltransferase family protein [Pedobacter sp. AW1-32]|uniref:acyltransferase family protein n=1 Tax=Pedobacter sp. AW1-32 TaxID=3383026 RepID=UPI003FEE4348